MKNGKQCLPVPLTRQVCFRIGAGILFFLPALFLSVLYRDFLLPFPFLLFSAFFLGSGLHLWKLSRNQQFVILTGVCCGTERSWIQKRINRIYLTEDAEGIRIQILVKQKVRQIQKGDRIQVYVSKQTPVYDCGNEKLLCSFLALEKI